MTARYPKALLSRHSRRRAIACLVRGLAITPAVWMIGGCARAQGDGETDVEYLSRVLQMPRPTVPFRREPYRVSRSLVIPPGKTLQIASDCRFRWVGPESGPGGQPIGVFVAGGDDTAIVCEQPGARVECPTPMPMVFAALMTDKSGFELRNIISANCGHVHVTGGAGSNARQSPQRTPGETLNRVLISGGGATYDSPQQVNIAACLLSFVDGAVVTGSRYRNVHHGVQWWGGDANPARDGNRANPRNCRNLLIEDVVVQSATQGGIWGSMGADISVRNCVVEGAGDVCFDAEGSDRVIFDGCRAANGKNGCFTTFFLCDGVTLTDCEASVDDRSYPLIRIHNSTQSNLDNRRFVVRGGRFACTDAGGVGTIDTRFGPVGTIELLGLELDNVRIDLAYSNMHRTIIRDTVLQLSRPLECKPAIRVGSSKSLAGDVSFRPGGATVENNVIRYAPSAPTGCSDSAIAVVEDDFNSSAQGRIIGNEIAGPFATAISLINASPNPGITPTFTVSRNRFQGQNAHQRQIKVGHSATARRPQVLNDQGRAIDLLD